MRRTGASACCSASSRVCAGCRSTASSTCARSPSEDRELIEHTLLFAVFHRYLARARPADRRAGTARARRSCAWPFAAAFLDALGRAASRAERAERLLELCYQMRRAFHFIATGLIGRSARDAQAARELVGGGVHARHPPLRAPPVEPHGGLLHDPGRRDRHRQGRGGGGDRALRLHPVRRQEERVRVRLRRELRADSPERVPGVAVRVGDLRPQEGRVHRRGRAPRRRARALPRRTARCSSTRSARPRCRCRSSCCACCRSACTRRSAAASRGASTAASWRRRTARSTSCAPTARCATTSSTACARNVIEVPPLRVRLQEAPGELAELCAHLCARITGSEQPRARRRGQRRDRARPRRALRVPGQRARARAVRAPRADDRRVRARRAARAGARRARARARRRQLVGRAARAALLRAALRAHAELRRRRAHHRPRPAHGQEAGRAAAHALTSSRAAR